MPARLRAIARVLGWGAVVFLALLLASWVAPASRLLRIGAYLSGVWLVVRLLRKALRRALWRLRHRLLAAYLFMAVVPILLIATLAVLAARAMASQLAVYLVTSELDRRVDELERLGRTLAEAKPADRRIDSVSRERYPSIAAVLRESGRESRYPPDTAAPTPVGAWNATRGVMVRQKQFYLWSHEKTPAGDVTVTVPLTREFLSSLVPNLGQVGFGTLPGIPGQPLSAAPLGRVPPSRAPPPLDRLDPDVQWFAAVPALDWEHPAARSRPLIVAVRSRFTALATAMIDPDADLAQGLLLVLLGILAGLFVIVELVALVIGVRLTRSITGAVHRLYEGTQMATAGDFSHRIEVKGRDQLADLGRSFNVMTESIEHLLLVAKEKERLQSEMEIAREVQSQLYPRRRLETPDLRVTGMCHPASVVSGDYFDYETLRDGKLLLAIGDVAGKGISAALLMASLQSSLRMQLAEDVSASQMVRRINEQLYAATTPEKFASFCAGTFDESGSVFTYTNAGHLPPLVIRNSPGRNGAVEKLEVNGLVVGMFPRVMYSESCVSLERGDLLVFYTDGVSEPENAYGEMFGDAQLAELISRSAHLSEEQILEAVWKGVREWTGQNEMPDDMTLLLARKL